MKATAVKERPILFSGEMVRAILAGTKTQTRRPIAGKYLDMVFRWAEPVPGMERIAWLGYDQKQVVCASIKCPYGQIGDRLWVREKWRQVQAGQTPIVIYGADDRDPELSKFLDAQHMWRPSIHMPRWASRLTLEVTNIRVERVQNISHRDALAEGVVYDVSKPGGAPVPRFQKAWNSLYSNKPGLSWESNPWVWAITFKRIEVQP